MGKRRYVLLASNSYSGSTLLSFLLGAHPQIGTVSDVSGSRRSSHIESFPCSCGLLMRDCPFWKAVQRRAMERGLANFDLADFGLGFDVGGRAWLGRAQARSLRWSWLESVRDAALRPFGTVESMAAIGHRTWIFAEVVLDVTGGEVFLDASKERMRIRYLSRYLPQPISVIHLTRDVRGVVDSTLRRGKTDLNAAAVAQRWARTNDAILRQLRDLPGERKLLIRYEDLCREPEAVLERAFAFCDVDHAFYPSVIPDEMHLLGNSMRLRGVGGVRLDESWRDRLTSGMQEEIIKAARPVFGLLYPDVGV